MEFETPFTMYGAYSDGQTFDIPVIDTEALNYFLHMHNKGLLTIERFDGEPATLDPNSLFSRAAFTHIARQRDTNISESVLDSNKRFLGGFTFDVNSLYPTLTTFDGEPITEAETVDAPKKHDAYRLAWDCVCGERHSVLYDIEHESIGDAWKNVVRAVRNLTSGETDPKITVHANSEVGVWLDITHMAINQARW